MARAAKKTFEATGADPVLRDEDGLSPADNFVPALTELQIKTALKDHIEAGIKVRVTHEHWFLDMDFTLPRNRGGLPRKKTLSNSGSVHMPLKPVIAAADFLYSQVEYIESVLNHAAKNPKYHLVGQITGKGGEPLDAA